MEHTHSFKAAWWLGNTHLQTIWPVICRRPIDIPLKRERLELPDGDFIDLEWTSGDLSAPLVLVLHGLEGSIESHYAKGMLKALTDQGYRAVFMHFRGCSGEPNRMTRDYHSGDTHDLQFVVDTILRRYSPSAFSAVGFSLGGNVLLKWLGETEKNNPLTAAVAISVPFELKHAANRIQTGFSRFYQWYFINCLRDRLTKKFESLNITTYFEMLNNARTMYEFDHHITAPRHGFSGVDDYYSQSSSRPHLKNISVPTLILHAKDDPFMSEKIIPEAHELSPHVTLELTEKGGHVGFITGSSPWEADYWLEKRVPRFFKQFFK